MLKLFDDKRLQTSSSRFHYDMRAILNVEFMIRPFPYGDRKYMFGIEIKTGPKRLYIVQIIRDFLYQIDRREDYVFSRHITYDPKLHSFRKEVDAVIRQLIQIYRNEKMYRETTNHYSFRNEPIPLHFEFGLTEEHSYGYRLDVQGLDKIIVMESYGLTGLEFQYGEIVINPLESGQQSRAEDRILIREGDLERKILELMEQGAFSKTSGYFMEDEDSEYEFMYHVLPELEKLVDVYATSAVKERLHINHVFPMVKIDVDERTDWLEFKFDFEGIPESDIRKLLKSLDEKRKYHRLPGGALLPLESTEFREIIRLMNEMGIRGLDVKGTELRLPVLRGLQLIGHERQGNVVSLGKSLRRFLENMRNPDNLDFPIPDCLENVLRDYQKYGFQWMKTLAHHRFGGILADDMGFGKILQSSSSFH